MSDNPEDIDRNSLLSHGFSPEDIDKLVIDIQKANELYAHLTTAFGESIPTPRQLEKTWQEWHYYHYELPFPICKQIAGFWLELQIKEVQNG